MFLEALEGLYRLKGREVLGGVSPEKYHHGQGFLRAIETVATLPETLATVMTRVQTDERRKHADDSDSEQRNFYGTPYWDGPSPDRVARPGG